MTALRREIDRLTNRLDQIDQGGTRGVGVLHQQITDLARDVAELKGEGHAWQQTHELQHQNDTLARVNGRRWVITTVVAVAAIVVGLLVAILAQLH